MENQREASFKLSPTRRVCFLLQSSAADVTSSPRSGPRRLHGIRYANNGCGSSQSSTRLIKTVGRNGFSSRKLLDCLAIVTRRLDAHGFSRSTPRSVRNYTTRSRVANKIFGGINDCVRESTRARRTRGAQCIRDNKPAL